MTMTAVRVEESMMIVKEAYVMSAATTSAAGRLTDAELKAQEKAARKAEKARQKRIAADEAAERKRSAKAGFANVNNPRRSTLLTVLCAVFAVYCLFPVRTC